MSLWWWMWAVRESMRLVFSNANILSTRVSVSSDEEWERDKYVCGKKWDSVRMGENCVRERGRERWKEKRWEKRRKRGERTWIWQYISKNSTRYPNVDDKNSLKKPKSGGIFLISSRETCLLCGEREREREEERKRKKEKKRFQM
jgi:hypothetical protein